MTQNNISVESKTLKDYIPLVISFFAGLLLLSIYQNTVLYAMGVLDSVFNSSLFVFMLHHLGYAAVCSVVFAFVFNLLENKKYNLGFKLVRLLFAVLLIIEGILITYFIGNYEPLNASTLFGNSGNHFQFNMLQGLLAITATLVTCYFLYRFTAPFYKVISRMYPFTIILFSMFLATLYSDRKPINENKTQHFLETFYGTIFKKDTYKGQEEYPLARPYVPTNDLKPYFNLGTQKPHIKILIVEGLGKDFVDANGKYSGIMPHLQELTQTALYWPNFLSNTGEGQAALPTILGSLPFGESGFTNLVGFTHRHTLFSVLKQNGYNTSFNYGGNSALNSYDRFLVQEGVNMVIDKSVFGTDYTLQDEDAAGITLGYPDKALFRRYAEQHKLTADKPKLEIFQTLSTKAPYAIPDVHLYEQKIEQLLGSLPLDKKDKRFINHNLELFSSYGYADDAIYTFLNKEKELKEFKNTIYIITGSHLNRNIPSENALNRYQVPLILYSPLVKHAAEIQTLASHADIAPALISLLDKTYALEVPQTIAWLGNGALAKKGVDPKKEIPLYRYANNIKDHIYGTTFLTDGDVAELNPDLSISDKEVSDTLESNIRERFRNSKSVNKYVTQNDKIIPSNISSITNDKRGFSKTELVWLQSVFNGKDFDNAYATARKLAFDKDWERALLLCEHILTQIPRHADTEILKGRIYAWKKDYEKSVIILKEVVRKYPDYADGYAALLDTYFWAYPQQDINPLLNQIERHELNDALLSKKIQRAVAQKLAKATPIVNLDMP